MDTRDFLSRVVAWPEPGRGYINLHWHLPGGPFKGVAVENIDAFLREVDKARELGQNIYFCLSQQREARPNGTKLIAIRNRLNATAMKAVWLDIDVGKDKPYATPTDAAVALKAFIEAAKLPQPSAIVASGSGGLHVYWISDHPLIPAVWQGYADRLRHLADQHGLAIDGGCTTDAARVLRVPDTLNHKHTPPKPVELLDLGKEYNFAEVPSLASAPETGTLAPGRTGLTLPARFQGRVAKIGADIEELPPITDLKLDPIIREGGCGFLKEAYDTGGKKFHQPLWNLTTLCATFMENGHDLAHRFGNKHSEYSVGSTDALWERKCGEREAKGLGFPSCAAIRRENGEGWNGCKTCPHFGQIVSPLNLATLARAKQPRLPGNIGPGGNVLDGTATGAAVVGRGSDGRSAKNSFWRDTLPDGYRYKFSTQQIEKHIIPKKGDDDGDDDDDVEKFWVPLFRSQIINEPWVQAPPNVGVHIKVQLDPVKTFDAFIPLGDCTRTKVVNKLFNQNVIPNSKLQPAVFEDFMGSWIEKMNSYINTKERLPFGWREDAVGAVPIGFAFGGTLYKNNGTTEACPLNDKEMKDHYTPCGSEEAWRKAADLILKQNKPELEIVIAASFAGPLMRILGEDGAHLAVWSSGSGAHKSTASKIAAAVWGHPQKIRHTKGSSWKGAVKALGDTVNLTAYWDDIQNDKEMERLADTGLQLCQGSEGLKLHQDRTYHDVGNWQTLCVSCSNMSVVDWLVKKQGSTDFRINRVFEVQHIKVMKEGVVDNVQAMQTVGNLNRNYGRMGLRYAELLANNAETVFKVIAMEAAEFKKDVIKKTGIKEDSANRYWLASCVTTLAAVRLANTEALNVGFHYDAIRKRLVDAFEENLTRKTDEAMEGGTSLNTQSNINRFLKAAGAGNSLWTEGAAKKGGHGTDKVVELQGPERGRELWAHAVTDKREIRISKDKLVDWCSEFNVGYSSLLRGLRTHYNVDNKRYRLTLGAGTSLQRGPEIVIIIPVPEGSVFETFLFAHGGLAKEQIT
jgi:hypothetical protein